MKSFDEWYFDLFESGNGSALNQQEIAEEAWDFRQAEVDELKRKLNEIVILVRDNTPDYYLDNMIDEILKGDSHES